MNAAHRHRAAIALGSNLGARPTLLNNALDRLRAHPQVEILSVSNFHETDPVGGPPGQLKYINAAAVLATSLQPRELLELLLEIERTLGRDRSSGIRNAPRTIDLDVLLYDDAIIDEPNLCVPHPRMHEREFVLRPLSEIAGDWVHARLKRSVGDLLRGLK